MATYTVQSGDCLWTIAANCLGSGTKWTALADLNGISRSNPIIYPGQVLQLDYPSSSETTAATNVSSKAVIDYFGLQAGTDKTIFATWTWDRSNTKNYQVIWYYDAGNTDSSGNTIWFIGSDSTVTDKQTTYSAPSNAVRIKFKVKPISETYTSNDTEVSYWTATWSTEKEYNFSDNPPSVPSAPTVTISNYTLTAELDNLDVNGTSIQFQVVKDNATVFNTGSATIITNSASYSCSVDAGSEYKVRCRACRAGTYSGWSEYSSNAQTIPAAPTEITICRANSETSVYLEWSAVSTATSYNIEYATKREYFDGSDQTTIVSSIEFTHYEKTGLETGAEYFFRVSATNSVGDSSWSDIRSTSIGSEPAAPTTWSSTTTAIVAEPLTLYWIHNAEDGSSQTYAEVEIITDGLSATQTIRSSGEDDENLTQSYSVDTSNYVEGVTIQWRVRTAGVTLAYGDWSIQRTINVYAPPTLTLSVTDADSVSVETLTEFPFYISALAGPNTQAPVGYHVTVTANSSYETVDNVGHMYIVKQGEAVYSKYFDIGTSLTVIFSADNIDLENNVGYTITCLTTMNSGLTVEASHIFFVAWTDVLYEPNAAIGIDYDTLAAYIRPYCVDENGDTVQNLALSLYRRAYDGDFVKIASGLSSNDNTYVTDPHPALDFARYRVVAIDETTGAVSYCDIPAYPVNEKSVVIQWAEEWSNFETSNDDALAQPAWSGSILKLPYNIDVSDDYSVDVSLVEYSGRNHPVSYYGTQHGVTSNWSMIVPKDDLETLYALRRLAIWEGDVYVREPSGSGYWANISVSFGQKHLDLTIPVTLNITRVEGGT